MVFIDYPRFYPLSDYETAIAKMVEVLKKNGDIVSIYQLGSIGHPGISDIDILVVFKDSTSFASDPRASLSKKEKYLLSHGLYGLSEVHVPGVNKYGFYFHPKLLWGKDLIIQYRNAPDNNELKILKTQVALEFLVKMYINTAIEQTYKIIKVRAFLLQAKALLLDLDLLDIQKCRLREMLRKILAWREYWFDSPPRKSEIIAWLIEFQREFPLFLNHLLQNHPFYLQSKGKMRIGTNVEMKYSRELSVAHKGITFPWLGFLGRRYFNLLHRFNQFDIKVPFQNEGIPKILSESQRFYSLSKLWLADHAKYFMPLSSSLMSSIVN